RRHTGSAADRAERHAHHRRGRHPQRHRRDQYQQPGPAAGAGQRRVADGCGGTTLAAAVLRRQPRLRPGECAAQPAVSDGYGPGATERDATGVAVAAVTAIAAEVPAHTVATKAADADAVASPLPDDFPTRRPDTAMHTGTDAAKAAHAEPEPLHLPVGSGIGPAAGHPSRLVEHPALRGAAMRSRRLGGARLVGLLVTLAAAAFAVMVFLP